MSSVTLVKTRKVGGSLVVTIPKNVVQSEQLAQDQFIEVTITKTPESYRGILKMTRFHKEDKLDVHDY
ncbi:hypothetical protein J4219_05755 [Candidatus Woesearchaeota archaeon]|nr:hypothetical protein [Candidatus Woesearchaeota archaeon]